jgi:hypothetical protein
MEQNQLDWSCKWNFEGRVVWREPGVSEEYNASILRAEEKARQETSSLTPSYVGFLLGSLFHPEHGDDMFTVKRRAAPKLHGVTTQKVVLSVGFNF